MLMCGIVLLLRNKYTTRTTNSFAISSYILEIKLSHTLLVSNPKRRLLVLCPYRGSLTNYWITYIIGSRKLNQYFMENRLWVLHFLLYSSLDNICLHCFFNKGGHPQFKTASPQYCGTLNQWRSCGLKKIAELRLRTFKILLPQFRNSPQSTASSATF